MKISDDVAVTILKDLEECLTASIRENVPNYREFSTQEAASTILNVTVIFFSSIINDIYNISESVDKFDTMVETIDRISELLKKELN